MSRHEPARQRVDNRHDNVCVKRFRKHRPSSHETMSNSVEEWRSFNNRTVALVLRNNPDIMKIPDTNVCNPMTDLPRWSWSHGRRACDTATAGYAQSGAISCTGISQLRIGRIYGHSTIQNSGMQDAWRRRVHCDGPWCRGVDTSCQRAGRGSNLDELRLVHVQCHRLNRGKLGQQRCPGHCVPADLEHHRQGMQGHLRPRRRRLRRSVPAPGIHQRKLLVDLIPAGELQA